MLGLRDAQEEDKLSGKFQRLNIFETLKLVVLSEREVCGMRGVAVKCRDITQHSDCEGSIPALN